ncbi:MAG: nucleoside triphosphate pyrophosphohydrolase [Flavobacteriales bacterium]|nr:nucleoside triphosphate pyrophosphohydrolase [Flavobacteriales bacterium]
MSDVKIAFEKLVSIMLELREKCPWDKKQTNESLRYLTLEECYELSDAIVENDSEGVKEELGDVILHVIFYSIIASEKKQFNLTDVLNAQIKKLIDRHPHIYSNVNVKDESDVKRNWELLKLKEKQKKSILSGVPRSLPSMLKSYRIQEKVKGVGFDFPDDHVAFDKIIEEIQEFKDEIHNDNLEKAEQELGDILFALIGYAQMNGINSMNALEKTNQKFINRFTKVEEIISNKNKHLSDYSKDELSAFLRKVKSDEL